jgi:hypothetical protein
LSRLDNRVDWGGSNECLNRENSTVDNRQQDWTHLRDPIRDEAISAVDLRQIKVTDDDFGLLSYDPAFLNTASCRSAITYIDGDRGILRYRGLWDTLIRQHDGLFSPDVTKPIVWTADRPG